MKRHCHSTSRAEALANELASKQLAEGVGAAGTGDFGKSEDVKQEVDDRITQLQEYNDTEKLKDVSIRRAEEAALARFERSAGVVKTVMDKMSFLKNKYSSILNSNDMSTATKAKSLNGRPFRERWIIGGNFNVASTAPLMIDLSPQFGYRIDQKLQVGLSGIYRATFVDTVRIANSISPERYGYSVFGSYGLYLNFFGYAEFERTVSIVKSSPDHSAFQWTNALLLGLGRKFRVHPKVNGTLLVLWNPLHKNGTTPYRDSFVIKTGFNLSELAMLKRK